MEQWFICPISYHFFFALFAKSCNIAYNNRKKVSIFIIIGPERKQTMSRYDPLTDAERSERMSRVRNADTKPEMIVRRLVHGMGYRYGLHARDLPGNPDLAFRPRKKVIFVHGCFWHQHSCNQYRQPRTKREFWEPKLAKNKERDTEVRQRLRKLGWRVMVVWECQIRKKQVISNRIKRFLDEK